jgi:Outer membrane lipoprotein-sorting protein
MRTLVVCLAGLLFLSLPLPGMTAGAASPDVGDVMRRMKAALEPSRATLRKIDVIIAGPDGNETRWEAREARKQLPTGNRIAFVMLEPAEVRGSALLIAEQKNGPDEQWVYLPTVRRVRKILPIGGFHPFLGTDFTYADLGFIRLTDREFKLLGTEKLAEGNAYEVEEVPEQRWYYSRIVDWISTDNLLPIKRDYYSPGGDLWKTEFFESVTVVDGVPTPLMRRMVDRPEGGGTVLRIVGVEYDSDIPDEIFTPAALPTLVSAPIWAHGPRGVGKGTQ